MRKKLIEVSIPLEAINAAASREKSIRHGHPSTLHLWWARRPLAAARAVIFAQMVDDPSSRPELFPTPEAQEQERQRLFDIIKELVKWENSNNETVLNQAREEIRKSWRLICEDHKDDPCAAELYNFDKLPEFHDPFAGGGAIPLEAQRLGLTAYASDLNPVAVLINKAMIEIPPKFSGMPPVNPEARNDKSLLAREWKGTEGLAEDVRYYGKWMRTEAQRRIGKLYPKIKITQEMAAERPDLEAFIGKELTVVAWLWARTVRSPNPAFANINVPLVSNFMLSTKKDKEVYVEPILDNNGYRFSVKMGRPEKFEQYAKGTTAGKRNAFVCLMSGVSISYDYIRSEGKHGRLGTRLMAIVAEGDSGRLYLPPDSHHEDLAKSASPVWVPELPLPENPRDFKTPNYGVCTFGELFTSRQLVALTTFSELISLAIKRAREDAVAAGALNYKKNDIETYAHAINVYLSVALSRLSDICNSFCGWEVTKTQVRHLFTRQAIPMLWDFAENNVFGMAAGDYGISLGSMIKSLIKLPANLDSFSCQCDAQSQELSKNKVVSTDPPYYDNIGYADLSDFFYIWLRQSLQNIYPELFSTVAVPKAEELIATPYRHGTKEDAEIFFLDGMTRAMSRLANQIHPAFPITIYYAFKQSETKSAEGTSSTGWETFLDALIRSGLSITGTWPMRTELENRMIGSGKNALASSIILVCRKRVTERTACNRREFLKALKDELPQALHDLQLGGIAPVDLAQAAIGPGMAVFTRHAQVLEADGSPITVRQALVMINEVLDQVLAEQEGEFDTDSRWALDWFSQYGFDEGLYGTAETLSTAKNTSVQGLAEAGIITSKSGKVRLLRPEELPKDWDPATDKRLTIWEIVHQLIRALDEGGETSAAALLAKLGSHAESAKMLTYRLYQLCERKKRAADALAYNSLAQSWSEIGHLARNVTTAKPKQGELF